MSGTDGYPHLHQRDCGGVAQYQLKKPLGSAITANAWRADKMKKDHLALRGAVATMASMSCHSCIVVSVQPLIASALLAMALLAVAATRWMFRGPSNYRPRTGKVVPRAPMPAAVSAAISPLVRSQALFFGGTDDRLFCCWLRLRAAAPSDQA